jgi:hypothetical protein
VPLTKEVASVVTSTGGAILASSLRAILTSALIGLACHRVGTAAEWPQHSMPFELHEDLHNSIGLDGIRLLGALDLSAMTRQYTAAAELSGLAWDPDEQLLYAVTDEGRVLSMQVRFANGQLSAIKLQRMHRLRDPSGAPLTGKRVDSEGLYLRQHTNDKHGDTELFVAFERVPRIDRYRANGRLLGPAPMPRALADLSAYQSGNKGMEAVSVHPQFGAVSGTEWPLIGAAKELVTFYAQSGATATMPRLAEANAGLVGLHVMPDASLLVLERAHSWLGLSLVVELSRTSKWTKPAAQALSRTRLARFDSSLGWRLDNFEGLAHHQGNKFFIVSDDNGSALQTTLLVYFELL